MSASPSPLIHGTFHATTSSTALRLTDCAKLDGGVLMPWIGFGTYKLGASSSYDATLMALRSGYRLIDTAYIYAGEKTEREVGRAIADALVEKTLGSREELFVTTKHWRSFHGYEPALKCLDRSLDRLGLQHVDMWMMVSSSSYSPFSSSSSPSLSSSSSSL